MVKKTGAIIHIMHINSTGGTFHMEKALEMVNKAREEGLDITACVYPYDFGLPILIQLDLDLDGRKDLE